MPEAREPILGGLSRPLDQGRLSVSDRPVIAADTNQVSPIWGLIISTDDEAKIAQSYRSHIFSSLPARGKFLKI
jgi:hypothetical protein